MTGLRVKRKADRTLWTISGEFESGVVLTPDEFGSPIRETLAGLHDGYVVVDKGDTLPAGPTAAGDEAAGWQALADASWEAAQRVEQRPEPQQTVEQVFARVARERGS